jgi:hypothetical protein
MCVIWFNACSWPSEDYGSLDRAGHEIDGRGFWQAHRAAASKHIEPSRVSSSRCSRWQLRLRRIFATAWSSIDFWRVILRSRFELRSVSHDWWVINCGILNASNIQVFLRSFFEITPFFWEYPGTWDSILSTFFFSIEVPREAQKLSPNTKDYAIF